MVFLLAEPVAMQIGSRIVQPGDTTLQTSSTRSAHNIIRDSTIPYDPHIRTTGEQ
jgi:hypothetical protein